MMGVFDGRVDMWVAGIPLYDDCTMGYGCVLAFGSVEVILGLFGEGCVGTGEL